MIRRLIIAVQFLTIIPLSGKHSFTDEDLGKSMLYFPLVGLLIGGILVCTRIPLSLGLPEGVVDALLIAFLVVITGAMHLDALADTADGNLNPHHRPADARKRSSQASEKNRPGPIDYRRL